MKVDDSGRSERAAEAVAFGTPFSLAFPLGFQRDEAKYPK